MNDLGKYLELRGRMADGDLVYFDGSDMSDVVHLVSDFVPNAIHVLTGAGLTHVGMLRWKDGLLYLVDSTIRNGKSGPQMVPFADVLKTYDGRAWWAPLNPRVREFIDWSKVWTLLDAKIGKDHYAVAGLLKWIAQRTPFLNLVPAFSKSDTDSEFCSEMVLEALSAGGLPGCEPIRTSPRRLWGMKIHAGVEQLIGSPAVIPGFNSI